MIVKELRSYVVNYVENCSLEELLLLLMALLLRGRG